MKKISIVLSFLIGSVTTYGQSNQENSNKIYEVNIAVDLPIAVVSSALTAYGFKKIGEKSGSTPAEIAALNYNDVSKFNRFFSETPRYNESAAKVSDFFFYGSMPLGLALAVDKNMRSDFGTIALMYWEAMAITGAIYSNTAANVIKYRPLAYTDKAPMPERTEDGAKNSFPGGHPTMTATATFFMAKVIQDYYPHRKGLHIAAYSTAAALTFTNAYLRHTAGKHFASDLVFGLSYSIPIGILVPQLHKIAKNNDKISFYNSGDGVTLAYIIE